MWFTDDIGLRTLLPPSYALVVPVLHRADTASLLRVLSMCTHLNSPVEAVQVS